MTKYKVTAIREQSFIVEADSEQLAIHIVKGLFEDDKHPLRKKDNVYIAQEIK